MKGKGKSIKHVAIIPDGNRRWAIEKGMKGIKGHEKSATYENLKDLMQEARDLGVEYMTFWGFSTENWKRSKTEINYVFGLIEKLLTRIEEDLIRDKIRFRHLGRRDRLPKKLIKVIDDVENATKEFEDFNLQICIDYGGRDEIVRALNKALRSGVQEINEEDFVNFLDSEGIPDPDLIIRTSGENRLSGFMSFQSAYSEFYFTNVHFPEFGAAELRKAVEEFTSRGRRFGGG
tara:strand:+ start:582 stop:1280 length:699 start_codon:yes stop_codon:yes gene_type:complete